MRESLCGSRIETHGAKELLDKLPPAESYGSAAFPSLDEQAAAKEAITKKWDSVVGANVK